MLTPLLTFFISLSVIFSAYRKPIFFKQVLIFVSNMTCIMFQISDWKTEHFYP